MHKDGNAIASVVLAKYESLSKKGKPLVRSNGVHEWTILAGIVIWNKLTKELDCVSLATGVKAMPDKKIANSNGQILHDCHAEILAIRAFNYYCIESGIDHIGKVYLYISAPPCGDASMGNLKIDGEEWTRDAPPEKNSLIRGRGFYSYVGHIRTKPGRGDSIVTMSKSCSDKLCLRQSRGLLLCTARRIFRQPLYLDAIACPGINYSDFDRAFSRWSPNHRFEYFKVTTAFEDTHPDTGAPSPCSLIWTPYFHEVTANGVIQGSRRPSSVCRRALLKLAAAKHPSEFANISRYSDLKLANQWPPGWERTAADDFNLAG